MDAMLASNILEHDDDIFKRARNSWRCSSAKQLHSLIDSATRASMLCHTLTSRKKCNSRRTNCTQHHVFVHYARNSGNCNRIQPTTQTTAPASTLDGGRSHMLCLHCAECWCGLMQWRLVSSMFPPFYPIRMCQSVHGMHSFRRYLLWHQIALISPHTCPIETCLTP